MKKIVLTGGGTAGHVTPNIALLPALCKMGCEIHYIGDVNGMEKRLMAPFDFVTYHGISTGKLRRYLSVQNLKDPFKVLKGISQSKKLLGEIRPDVIFAKGGFVSVPVVMAAKKHKIPVVLHESDFTIGLANRISAPRASIVCTSFAPTVNEVKGGHGVWTGSPVREELLHATRTQAQDFFKFPVPEQPTLVFMGGSLGAQVLGERVADLAKWEIAQRDFLHVHATGSIEKADFAALAARLGIDHSPKFIIREYIDNMPEMLAAADLVISRAGALTLAEIAAVGRASVLIPSPNVAENHQYHNAMQLQKLGAAVVVEEKELTGEKLIGIVDKLTKDPAELMLMGAKARALAQPDSLDKICENLDQLMKTTA